MEEFHYKSQIRDKEKSANQIYDKIINDNYDKLCNVYPILRQLQCLVSLSSLVKTIVRKSNIVNLDYWLFDYKIMKVETPKKIRTINREVSGLAYSVKLTGAIILHPMIYKARAGDPTAIRNLALKNRPSDHSLTWSFSLNSKNAQTQSRKIETENLSNVIKKNYYIRKNNPILDAIISLFSLQMNQYTHLKPREKTWWSLRQIFLLNMVVWIS